MVALHEDHLDAAIHDLTPTPTGSVSGSRGTSQKSARTTRLSRDIWPVRSFVLRPHGPTFVENGVGQVKSKAPLQAQYEGAIVHEERTRPRCPKCDPEQFENRPVFFACIRRGSRRK